MGCDGLFFKASLWLPRTEWTVEREARQKIGKLVRGLLLWPRDEMVITGAKGVPSTWERKSRIGDVIYRERPLNLLIDVRGEGTKNPE